MPLRECSEGTWIAHVSGSSRFNIGTLSQTTSLPLVILPDMTTDVMCMCHVGGGAATDSPRGGNVMGPVPGPRGGTTPEDNSENISRIFVGSVHACTCFSRCAHCVLGVPVRLLRVSSPPARLEIRGTAKGQRRLIDLKPGEIRSVKLEITHNRDRSQVID